MLVLRSTKTSCWLALQCGFFGIKEYFLRFKKTTKWFVMYIGRIEVSYVQYTPVHSYNILVSYYPCLQLAS